MADLHEIAFALEAHRAAQKLEEAPPDKAPFLEACPLWRILLGLALLALNVWLWWLILAK